MHRIKQLSADENAKRLAFVRERALHDEASLLYDAKQEGREEGREEGELKAKEAMAKSLIALAVLTDEQIVEVTGLPLEAAQVEEGMQEKSKEFLEKGSELYQEV